MTKRLNKCIFFVSVLIIVWINSVFALKPYKEYPYTPDSAGIKYEDVHFKTKDGLKLVGWFIPAQDTSGNIAKGVKPVIIITLADAGNIGWMMWHYINFFQSEKFHVLLFNWRGFGHSDSRPIFRDEKNKIVELIYPEFVIDLNAAIDYVKKRPEVDSTRIGLFGFSMGGVIIFSVASQRNDISAIMVRGIYTTIGEVMHTLSTLDDSWHRTAPHGYPAKLEPLWAAKNISCPVCIIVGENDERCTPDMARRIYANLNVPKELWIVPDAGHGATAGEMPEMVAQDEFRKRVRAFFGKYLKFEK